MTGKRWRAVTALAELSISHRSVITAAFSNLIYHWSIKIKSLMAKVIFSMDVFPLYLWIIWDLYLSRAVPARWPPPTTSRASFTPFGKWPVLRFSSFLYKIIMISIFLMNWTWPWAGLPCRGTLRARGLMIVLGCSSDSSNVDASLATHFWDPPFHWYFPPFRSISFYFFPTCILTSF